MEQVVHASQLKGIGPKHGEGLNKSGPIMSFSYKKWKGQLNKREEIGWFHNDESQRSWILAPSEVCMQAQIFHGSVARWNEMDLRCRDYAILLQWSIVSLTYLFIHTDQHSVLQLNRSEAWRLRQRLVWCFYVSTLLTMKQHDNNNHCYVADDVVLCRDGKCSSWTLRCLVNV